MVWDLDAIAHISPASRASKLARVVHHNIADPLPRLVVRCRPERSERLDHLRFEAQRHCEIPHSVAIHDNSQLNMHGTSYINMRPPVRLRIFVSPSPALFPATSLDPRRPVRQDTFNLRQEMMQDDLQCEPLEYTDEEHSISEDDSDGVGEADKFIDEDDSSSPSIPNESIDFDLVYSLHTFIATVEGQANVVKGDSLFLMDDTNSYWWLVRTLKAQEVGYIPAENIETPYECLARLNKHRNVDVRLRS